MEVLEDGLRLAGLARYSLEPLYGLGRSQHAVGRVRRCLCRATYVARGELALELLGV